MSVTQKITILCVIFLLAANLIHPWLGFSVYPRKPSPKNNNKIRPQKAKNWNAWSSQRTRNQGTKTCYKEGTAQKLSTVAATQRERREISTWTYKIGRVPMMIRHPLMGKVVSGPHIWDQRPITFSIFDEMIDGSGAVPIPQLRTIRRVDNTTWFTNSKTDIFFLAIIILF